MDILEQIQSLFDTYTNNEKKIAQFIIKDPGTGTGGSRRSSA